MGKGKEGRREGRGRRLIKEAVLCTYTHFPRWMNASGTENTYNKRRKGIIK